MIEAALRSKLIANTSLKTLVPSMYVGDTPYTFTYPFIRINGAGENPDDYRLKNRLIETVTVDIFAQHNPDLGNYGYPTLISASNYIRIMFDAFQGARWADTSHTFDVWETEYRGYAVQKNANMGDIHKPITITFTYNLIS